jgi:hypothetical protein
MPAAPVTQHDAAYLRQYEQLYAAWLRTHQATMAAEAEAATRRVPSDDDAARIALARREEDEAFARMTLFLRGNPL